MALTIECSIEVCVCSLYESGSVLMDLGDLKWRLFTKKQLEAQNLPLKREAF